MFKTHAHVDIHYTQMWMKRGVGLDASTSACLFATNSGGILFDVLADAAKISGQSVFVVAVDDV